VPRVSQSSLPATTPATSPAPHLFAGTSGWAYPTWKPGFYPATVSQKKFLEFYASQLNSVEVNYTFRTLPTAKMLEGWLSATPEHFRFSFKAPQRITHFKRLRECEADVAQFLESLAPIQAANRLGLLLFQLPPNYKSATSPASPKTPTSSSAITTPLSASPKATTSPLPRSTPPPPTPASACAATAVTNLPRLPPSPSASPHSPSNAKPTSTSSTRTNPPEPSTPTPS